MFTGLTYNRKTTTTVTYRRKPRFDPVVNLSSDDDSDLEEPSKLVPSSRSPQIILENNNNTVSVATTQNPTSNVLNNKKSEDRSSEDNEKGSSSPSTINDATQQGVGATQPPPTLLPLTSLPPPPSVPAAPTYLPSPQQQPLPYMPPFLIPSYPLPSIAANEQQPDMLSLGTYTANQSITQGQQLLYHQQEQQVLDMPFSIPLPLPYPQLDAVSWANTYDQSISMTQVSDPLSQFQSEQQQQKFISLGMQERSDTPTSLPPIYDHFMLTQQQQQQRSASGCNTSCTLNNNDDDATDREINVVQAESRAQNQQQAEPAPPDDNSPPSSAFDIFAIPELPIIPRRAAKVPLDKQQPSSIPSSKLKEPAEAALPDVFDINQKIDNVANRTTKHQPPSPPSAPSQKDGASSDVFDISESNVASHKAPTRSTQKGDDDNLFDIFDFPEKDDTNILELKLVSTSLSSSPGSSTSYSSSPAPAKQPRTKPLKRSLSQVASSPSPSPSSLPSQSSSSSTSSNVARTPTTKPLRTARSQRRTLSQSKKSKSDTSTTSSSLSTGGGSGRRVRFAPDILVSTFHRMSFDRSQPISEPTTFAKSEEQEKISLSVLSNITAAPSSSTQPPAKRKRNLVSRLRSATGEQASSATSPSLRRYNFDDEEDDDDVVDEKDRNSGVIGATQSMDEDEQEYRARMERELVAIMESDFGQDDDEEEGQENAAGYGGGLTRPLYQPKNTMDVRVTYQRKSKNASQQEQQQQQQQGHDREIAELDNLLDKLRAGGSDL
ncbi:hypothetical protein BDB00DRAFT_937612 [Zychaea mexicana]|uniref:uncharacterized protein n=1 Tax=Zychaea mexicana TaxID=64656 RepID=UPI0022FE6D09|nr:uncharacterized protein BDB00DRAFT_937612 [Zychaea mexicana]KAI9495543.1 hypothetical protein BDB00DRAFT_937612 [Zychaea mexicana]